MKIVAKKNKGKVTATVFDAQQLWETGRTQCRNNASRFYPDFRSKLVALPSESQFEFKWFVGLVETVLIGKDFRNDFEWWERTYRFRCDDVVKLRKLGLRLQGRLVHYAPRFLDKTLRLHAGVAQW